MQTLTLRAPAKLNLYLKVLNKRPDAFHNIETVFEKISLCDTISLKKRKAGIKVFCRHKDVPKDKTNLCFQAAKLLLAKAKRREGIEIRITKKIPVAAGLGGGSSDAASVLLGLNKLLLLGLRRSELFSLAQTLGADVPFFLLGQIRALGLGKGEELRSLRLKRKNWYVLIIPRGLKVSTRRMYQHPRLTLTKAPGSVKIVLRALEKGDLTTLNKYTYNSFEQILRKEYKEIQKIKKALKTSGAVATIMSGSGPCVFGMAQTRKEAMDISNRLKAQEKDWQVIVASTFNIKGGISNHGDHRGKNFFTR
ncbi:MAG: 4-(cytidine 5'-diphospho)-2-C-methyl-D-erythritol kinase [Omnitrophica bacterium]|nr:4-(cytidine 5'-diphospho)-2-C-methyl-D-erythritol kinase [Candidatus Omnitrophota bacterium]